MRTYMSMLVVAVLCSMVAAIAPSPAAAANEPIYAELALQDIRGLVYVEDSDRIVVSGDNEVQIYTRAGVRTHRLTGIGGALGAEAVGTYVAVAAPATGELVVIDTVAGVEVKRIILRAQNVSSIAAAGDTVWYAHGPNQWNAGIGQASVDAGTATPFVFDIYAGSIVAASPGLPDTVFGVQSSLSPANMYRYDLGDPNTELGNPYHSSFYPHVVLDSGESVLAFNQGNVIELTAETMEKTGFFYEAPEDAGNWYPRTGSIDQMMASDNDETLAAVFYSSVAVYDIGTPALANLIPFRGTIGAVDIEGDQVFVAETGRTRHGGALFPSRLAILDRDVDRSPTTVDIFFEAFGTPPDSSRPTLNYTCGENGGHAPGVYGQKVSIEVAWGVDTCSFSTSNLKLDTYYWYGVFHNDTWHDELSRYSIDVTGEPETDTLSFVFEFASPFNNAYVFVEQQFSDLLDRAPTQVELDSRANRLFDGTPPEQIVTELVESHEFLGSIAPLTRLYLAYFQRQPDDGGLSYWLGIYRGGTSVGAISDYFAQSLEFQNTYGSLTDRNFVELVYENVLSRPAEEDGLNYWVDLMSEGLTRGEVMVNFSESVENINNVQADIIVRALYYGMLDREPDAAGFDYWVGVYNAGGSLNTMVRAFIDSEEYGTRFWHDDVVPANFGSTPSRQVEPLASRVFEP